MRTLKSQKEKFSLPAGVTYLNCAYMSPLLKSVEKAGMEGIRSKRNPFAISSEDFFTGCVRLREEFAKLISAPAERIAIIASASYGISTVARNVKISRGESIVVTADQFPSNYYPWRRLADETGATLTAIAAPENAKDRGKIWNERILDAIKPGVKLVAMGHVHWTDGTRFDLEAIRRRTRDINALLVIDGTQSVGALPFDVRRIQPDALVCGGYKWMMGPYGIGLAYFGDRFDQGIPLEENWINRKNSEDFTALVSYASSYQPGALRYEVGEHSNFILVPMMTAALKQINQWQPGRIQEYCNRISSKAIAHMQEMGCWIEDAAYRGNHLFGLRFPGGKDIDRLKAAMRRKKIAVSFRGNSMRVAPHLYNDSRDFNKLISIL